jgi:t-SNARE complex subunit (syntaxin)
VEVGGGHDGRDALVKHMEDRVLERHQPTAATHKTTMMIIMILNTIIIIIIIIIVVVVVVMISSTATKTRDTQAWR